MSELDATQPSFPPYAELTQTQAWGKAPAGRVHADTNLVAEAVEISQASRYTEGPVLGTGGMGKVMLARDARIGRDVAVKLLHAERELDPEDRARFLREAQVQGQLEHPSIVPVYDIERKPDGTTFFTMRRVHGRTLQSIIEELKQGDAAATARYTQRELLSAFGTVCLAVDYAHTRGVVHRDLKPANIMLGDFGEVYVLDWGLARLVDEKGATAEEPHVRLSMPGAFLGTPMYMAPEQMADPDVGTTADVYSLGLILFELLTFERARDPQALFAPVDARPSVRAPRRNIAPELEAICVKATEGDPKDRYPSARALQEAIVAYLEGDRDQARRRELASEHTKQATAALERSNEPGADGEALRTEAVKHLRNALALDPANDENVTVLAAIVTTPPATMPTEVYQELKAAEHGLVRTGARFSVAASLAWFAFLPLIAWMGFRETQLTLFVLVPAALATTFAIIASRMHDIPYWIQLACIGSSIVGAAATTTLYGPVILAPTLIATFTIVLQAHPKALMRNVTWGLSILALIVISTLELIVPTSYRSIDGTFVVLPRMHELPRTESIIVLTVASIAMTIVPCVFIGRIRAALNAAQRQILTQAWQFRRFGEDLINRSGVSSRHADVSRVQ
jgi:serine/threonine-protein kinase